MAVHKTGRARAPADEGTGHRGRVGLTELCCVTVRATKTGNRRETRPNPSAAGPGSHDLCPFVCVVLGHGQRFTLVFNFNSVRVRADETKTGVRSFVPLI